VNTILGAGVRKPSWVDRIRNRAVNVVAGASATAYLWRCDRLGSGPRTLGRPIIVNHGRIEIGDDLLLDSRVIRTELSAAPGARIVIGARVSIGPGALVAAHGFVEIGDGVTIGGGCRIVDALPGAEEPKPIWIGDGVTLGEGVALLPGATVGAGSTIVAGSVVAGAIPPGVVAGGVPALPLGPAGRAVDARGAKERESCSSRMPG
jgi:acetyltransferase-like isoleucine patch superfamily enzyme